MLPLFWPAPEPTRTLSYGEFRRALQSGQLASVVVGSSAVRGRFKPGAAGTAPVRFRASRQGIQDDSLIPLLDQHVAGSYEAEEGPGLIETILPLAATLAFAAALLWLIGRRGGMGGAMAFARSRHKLYRGDQTPISFDDVAGVDEAVTELREVVDFLRTPERFRAVGGKIPKGMLLVGPPGTGKTLLARAVAGEAGVPFFSLSGSDFMEMFVGVGAARIRNLFEQAQSQAPCLMFIDEIDAIGKSRSAGGTGANEERDQTLNQLLVSLDGFDSNRGIIVMAATNRPETLDAALVRPGRFDRTVTVDRPNIDGREQILKVHARHVPMGETIDLRQIAAMTPGFVGAELANLVNEAALLAARRGNVVVHRSDFEQGVERLLAGPERKQKILRPDEQRRIAVHEAGHAVVSRSLPGTDPVHKVSIVGRGSGMGGYTLYRPEDDRFLHTRSFLQAMICGLLGGTLAEELVLGEISDGATSDLQRATQIARRMVTDFGMSRLGRVCYQTEGRSPFLPGGGASGDNDWSPETAREIDLEVRSILDASLVQTRAILERRRVALEAVVDRLVERETIDGAELQAILDAHPDVA